MSQSASAARAEEKENPQPDSQLQLQLAGERLLARERGSEERLLYLNRLYHDPDRNAARQELLIVAQALVFCGLPYKVLRGRDGSFLAHYVREAKTGRGRLRVIFGTTDPKIPIAFGQDRAVLGWLTTKALQTKSPTISWDTASEFFDAFQIAKGGAQYRLFGQRWRRLTSLYIKIEREGSNTEGHNRTLFADYVLPTPPESKNETGGQGRPAGVPYSVTFAADFYADLKRWPVPLPLPVMREFADEPMAWDFAGFLIYRSYLLDLAAQRGRDATARVALGDLSSQLGTTDTNPRRLRKSLERILDRLLKVWPEGRARFQGQVLELGRPVGGVHLVLPRS